MTEHCLRAEQFISLVAGRWTLPVINELACGGRRYQDLHHGLDGISHKVLTDTLRRLERDGLVMRHIDATRVETATLYILTDLGRSLSEPLAAAAGWSEANWPEVEAAHRRWDSRSAQPDVVS